MKRYADEILKRLLDKYERSISFIGKSKVTQSFSIQIGKEFPEYADDSRIQDIQAIDSAVSDLEEAELVSGKRQKNGLLSHVVLNVGAIDKAYRILKRKPKKDLNDELASLLVQYQGKNELLDTYCRAQLERIRANKGVEFFKGDIRDFEHLLMALANVFDVSQETFRRDFSSKVFGDSKEFERIRGTVVSALFEYGSFPNKETVLEDLNIVSNPGHIFFKGRAILRLSDQSIDLSRLDGDIAISSMLLKDIASIQVNAGKVITIENLTTFNAYKPSDELAIYLGGYHNSARRLFIKKLYEQNPECEYYHYGDIDAGGFYILLHLREKTGVPFQPFHMDVATLKANMKYAKKLTDNDRKRLANLQESEFRNVIRFMLENNCKLEQEALD